MIIRPPDRVNQKQCLRSGINLLCLASIVLLLSACNETGTTVEQKKKSKSAHLVATATSQIQSINNAQTRTGTVEALRQVKIFNQEEGKLTAIPYYPGDSFRKGKLLISMDGSLLRAQLDKARATRKQAELDLRRTTSLVKKRLAAEEERARIATTLAIAQAEEQLLKIRLDYTSIHAPFSGIVSERLIEVGDIAPRHSHLLTVFDHTSLIIRVKVSELLLPLFKINDPARITVDALGQESFNGRLSRIYPTIDAVTRTGIIEVSFNKLPERARPGFLSRVTLTPPQHSYLLIPFGALRTDKQGDYVFTINDKQLATKKYITTGIRYQNFIAVNDGLAENEAVIIKGFLRLKEGKKVTTSLKKKSE